MSTQLAFTSLQLTAYSKDSFNSYQLQQAATTENSIKDGGEELFHLTEVKSISWVAHNINFNGTASHDADHLIWIN